MRGEIACMNASTVGRVTWWDYVTGAAGGDDQATIARKSGVGQSMVSRWRTSVPRPENAAAFARAYGRPVLEAFIAAGFLTPEEAGEKPSAPPSLASLSDEDLLDAVRARMKGERQWGGSPGSEDDQGPDAGDRTGDQPSSGGGGSAGAEIVEFPPGRGPQSMRWDESEAGHLAINPFAKSEPEQPQQAERKRIPNPGTRREAARPTAHRGRQKFDEAVDAAGEENQDPGHEEGK